MPVRFIRLPRLLALTAILALAPRPGTAQELPSFRNLSAEKVRVAADRGDTDAQFILGVMFFRGEGGVRQDFGQAFDLLTKAANQGIAMAQLTLGDLCDRGTEVAQNDDNAAKWYRMAAMQGLPFAQRGLALLYASGRGVPQSFSDAAYWYRRAALQGDAVAQSSIGLLYIEGKGVSKDMIEGVKWLILAAAQGHRSALAKRDSLRQQVNAEDLAEAQRQATQFQPREDGNLALYHGQMDRILARATDFAAAGAAAEQAAQ
jgi:TPR repeat protein